jgi:hypothetical protein
MAKTSHPRYKVVESATPSVSAELGTLDLGVGSIIKLPQNLAYSWLNKEL